MDGGRKLVCVLCFIFVSILAGCAPTKSVSDVFPESSKGDAGGINGNPTCATSMVQNQFMVSWNDGRFEVIKNENVDDFIENFVEPNLQELSYVEYDKVVKMPEISEKLTLKDSSDSTGTEDWGYERVAAASAWANGIYGDGVTVGVVDSAVDTSHPQLKNQVVRGYDFVNNKSLGKVDSCNVHGTHVAGIIAAEHGAGNIKGVAPHAKIISGAFLGYESGSNCSVPKGGLISDAIKAIDYVVAEGATVINASWGGTTCSKTLADKMSSLNSRGVVFSVASGNESIDFDRYPQFYVFPAVFNLANQITVAASGPNDYMTTFSNVSSSLVHIAAPGEMIYSTVPGGYRYLDGTSMATPFVTAAVALMKSAVPGASVQQIKAALFSSVDKFVGRFGKVSSQGRLNVDKAVKALQNTSQ